VSIFRRKEKEPEPKGIRIIERRNEALGKTVYRVFRPGFISHYYSRPPQWEDFDSYDDALAYYHELTGWEKVREVQP
jgi:hypothetical protein